jgi:hypothetical protein
MHISSYAHMLLCPNAPHKLWGGWKGDVLRPLFFPNIPKPRTDAFTYFTSLLTLLTYGFFTNMANMKHS